MSDGTAQRIGDYEIIRELGHGGMGKVYLARNVISDRIEAMKVLLPDLAAREEFVTRFMREIKLLASLDHPNIAALRTAFKADDQFVMIMEYVQGVTLAEKLERGPFPIGDAINYTSQALDALSYAHGRHVIHRDIKPANMMLTPQGVVKLMDFGLARSATDFGLTATGTTLGSLDYSSPEQVQSLPTDERSDLYSVGVSLYQMVTGQRMFSATSSFSLMQAQVSEAPRPPITIVPTLPAALNDIILMSVAKDPAQRFQSAVALRQALSQVPLAAEDHVASAAATATTAVAAPPLTSPKPTPPPAPPSAGTPAAGSLPVAYDLPPAKPNRTLLVLGVLLLLALLTGGVVYKSRQHAALATPASAPQALAGAAAPGTTAPVTPPSSPSETPTPPATQTSAAQPSATPAAKTTAAARKAAPAHDEAAPPTGPSAADLEAEQRAAAERKKLMDDLETENDQLNSRAAAVESSLEALEQQMHNSGLGLRGDMVAARSNMRNDLAKAQQALAGGDTDRGRQFLDMAHREVEKLEGFLGRR